MVEGGEKGGGNRKEGVPPLGDDGDAVRRHHVEAVRLLHVEVVHERVKRGLRRERDTFLGKSHLHEGELHFLFGIVIRVLTDARRADAAVEDARKGRDAGVDDPLASMEAETADHWSAYPTKEADGEDISNQCK